MKPFGLILGGSFFFAALAMGLGGCGTVDDSGPIPAYGDYGYVGPWDYNYVELGGGGYARPPFNRDDHREPVNHAGPVVNRGGPSRGSEPAPARGGGIPSIPNAPRAGGGHAGGGGGGHSGGGGGSHGGGGGGKR